VRWALLRIFSAAASSAICAVPAAGQERAAVKPDQLPPVTVTSPESKLLKRVARPKPSQNRRTRTTTATGSDQPAAAGTGAGAGAVTPGASSDGVAALQPTAASAMRFTGEQVNAVPFARVGEALEVVPGLIVTQHSGEGKANQYFLRGFNLDHCRLMAMDRATLISTF